ncbi:MAG TPA: exodeoxyribonuclease V subunit gamma, partial [Chlamydiales bacterium]|nr:exodeoxyribonuclease V subunit gamma [Chlamydiales bacterium]
MYHSFSDMGRLFFSHRLELLADMLAFQIKEEEISPLAPRYILTPSSAMKQWLLLRCADCNGGIAGCKVYTLQEGLFHLFPHFSGFAENFSSLFGALATPPAKLLVDSFSLERRVELSYQLTFLLSRYGEEGRIEFLQGESWQADFFRKLCEEGKITLPAQVVKNPSCPKGSIHCFGLDGLFFELLQGLRTFSSLSLYFFSPTFHYWDDLCSVKEKKKLQSYWKKRGVAEEKWEELEKYLQEGPTLLANLGKRGRGLLKILDQFEWEIIEDYTEYNKESTSNLEKLQKSILSFENHKFTEPDPSIVLLAAGSSYLDEVEELYSAICHLLTKKQCSPSDIAVLAPDIQQYAPFIETVFSHLPYRMFGLNRVAKSFFYQGMLTLFRFASGKKEELLALLENPAFFKKRDEKSILRLKRWLEEQDGDEESLLKACIYLFPKSQGMPASFEEVEEWMDLLCSLRKDLEGFEEARTPREWANTLCEFVAHYLFVDFDEEKEVAGWDFFQKSVQEIDKITDTPVPFSWVRKFFERPTGQKELYASHLHAISFLSLREGNIFPVQHLFLMGMDEENFPRKRMRSSLDPFPSSVADQDRYLLLQTLFAARKTLQMSYCHLTPHEGKPVPPSFLIDELFTYVRPSLGERRREKEGKPAPLLPWPLQPTLELPEGEVIIPIAELKQLARHPWEFYLKKKWGVRLKEEKEDSFLLQKYRARKEQWEGGGFESLGKGIWGEALKEEVDGEVAYWHEKAASWELISKPLSFQLRKGAFCLQIGEKLRITLVGEIPFSSKGFLHFGEDSIGGVLRVWPECLIGALATGCNEIYFFKTGKVRVLEHVEEALKNFLSYYFLASSAPSPLL